MKIQTLFESINVRTTGEFYHGTNRKFSEFDITADSVNRATNVTGVYLTPSISEASEYGERILKVRVNPRKPFYSMSENEITDAMAQKAKELLLRFTTYKEEWLDMAIIPSFVERGNFGGMSDISGDIKREILLAGGYDAYVDGRHVVILEPNPNTIKILDEF